MKNLYIKEGTIIYKRYIRFFKYKCYIKLYCKKYKTSFKVYLLKENIYLYK